LDISHFNDAPVHTRYTSARYAEVAYRDIFHEGLLNGVDAAGGIVFGSDSVNPQFYRRRLAQAFLSVAQSNINNTDLKFDQFFAIASSYNESQDDIFANERVTAISSEGPLITKLTPGRESMLAGEVEISADVTDVTGIQRATFYLGDTFLGDAKNPLSPSLTFNSRRFPSGAHRLRINVLNKEGKEAELNHFVYLNNKAKRNNLNLKH
jgi:hypothetical protein